MSPDSPESRIGRLELKVAKLEQKVEDLLIHINARFDSLDRDVERELQAALDEARGARTEIASLRKDLEDRAETQRKERRADKWQTIVALLMTAGLIVATIQMLGGVG